MKSTSRAIKELEAMYANVKAELETRVAYYYSTGNTPADPIITINTKWRKKMPFDVSFKIWESKATQAMTVMAGMQQAQAQHYNEIRYDAAILSKPVDEIYKTVYAGAAYYWMKARSYNKTSTYITGSDRSMLISMGIQYDETKDMKDRFDLSKGVVQKLLPYTLADAHAFDLYSQTAVQNNTVGSPLKKWGCPTCGSSVRVSKKVIHLTCYDCQENYEYVDKDREYYYSNQAHKHDGHAYAACAKCDKPESNWIHSASSFL